MSKPNKNSRASCALGDQLALRAALVVAASEQFRFIHRCIGTTAQKCRPYLPCLRQKRNTHLHDLFTSSREQERMLHSLRRAPWHVMHHLD